MDTKKIDYLLIVLILFLLALIGTLRGTNGHLKDISNSLSDNIEINYEITKIKD